MEGEALSRIDMVKFKNQVSLESTVSNASSTDACCVVLDCLIYNSADNRTTVHWHGAQKRGKE